MFSSLWTFPGGVKLPDFKAISNLDAIQSLPLPAELFIPLRQHIGVVPKLLVKAGDYVYKGQLIAEADGYISAAVHATSSGYISKICDYPVVHSSSLKELCVVIKTDRLDQWHKSVNMEAKPLQLSDEEIRIRVRNAGIVGLGGAVFPSSVKLKPTRVIDTLIINGVECEPYISCDDVLMRERATDILHGILVLVKVIKPKKVIIAIEENKPVAYRTMLNQLGQMQRAGVNRSDLISVKQVPTKYPAGGEKQLIKTLIGKEIGSNSLPFEVGVVCMNVGTAEAVYNAVYKGHPLISRVMTLSGENIQRAGNYQVRIGTPIKHILNQLGVALDGSMSIIMGGPMMGTVVADVGAPVVKSTNCLLIKDIEAHKQLQHTMPCIRCGKCATVCPMRLMPQQLYWHARAQSFSKLAKYHLDDCIDCGCCQVVCPSSIPLVHYFRFAKSQIRSQVREQENAKMSRKRTESREDRLQRKKQEREERRQKRRAEMKKNIRAPDGDSQSKQRHSMN